MTYLFPNPKSFKKIHDCDCDKYKYIEYIKSVRKLRKCSNVEWGNWIQKTWNDEVSNGLNRFIIIWSLKIIQFV